MTLKEKFQNVHSDYLPLSNNQKNECIEIADNYAIEFLIWASQFALQRFDEDRWQVLGLADFGFTKTVSTKEILEQFKKEKGL
jgi:hypothetical protein